MTVAGIDVFMSRTGFSGELGYELIPARGDAERLWLALEQAGVRPVGFNAIDIARVEAGLIVFEYEYEPGQLHPVRPRPRPDGQLRTRDRLRGKAALQQLAAAPPRRLKTLRLEPGDLPETGTEVTKDGQRRG